MSTRATRSRRGRTRTKPITNGCKCARCWSAAEFFREKLGTAYGLPPAPGCLPHPEPKPLRDILRTRNRRYMLREAQMIQAQRKIEDQARRAAEDRRARSLGLERLTYEDLHPADADVRARSYL